MRDVASCIHSITGRIAIMDRKRKLEMANRLQLRWQRWEMSNYEYLMQACSYLACTLLNPKPSKNPSTLGSPTDMGCTVWMAVMGCCSWKITIRAGL